MSTVHDRGAAAMQRGPTDPEIHAVRDDDMDCCDVCAIPAGGIVPSS
jgi:hypothetical protein